MSTLLQLSDQTILAEARDHIPPGGLLLSYFVSNGEDGLHLAHSSDAFAWQPIAGGRGLLEPRVGENPLMRDPHICPGPDGTFHLTWTTGWGTQAIGYAASRDLIHWSPQRSINVMAHEPSTLNCWAPETVYDPTTGHFVIVWASTIRGAFQETVPANTPEKNHRQYVTTTTDFEHFTPTRLFYEPGFSVIDATFALAPGNNHRWLMCCKDETYEPPAKDLRLAWADAADGPYGPPSDPIYDEQWAEGPSIARLGRLWLIYFDKYKIRQYGVIASFDLQQWRDVSHLLHMPPGTRHATAFTAAGISGGPENAHAITQRLMDLH